MEKTINDEFMQHVVAEQAWKKLSEDFAWTEALLAKYSENVDCMLTVIGLPRLILKPSKTSGTGLD